MFHESGENKSHLALKHLLLATKSYCGCGESAPRRGLTFTRLELEVHLILEKKNSFHTIRTYWHINQLNRHVCIVESAIEEDGHSKHKRH